MRSSLRPALAMRDRLEVLDARSLSIRSERDNRKDDLDDDARQLGAAHGTAGDPRSNQGDQQRQQHENERGERESLPDSGAHRSNGYDDTRTLSPFGPAPSEWARTESHD